MGRCPDATHRPENPVRALPGHNNENQPSAILPDFTLADLALCTAAIFLRTTRRIRGTQLHGGFVILLARKALLATKAEK